MIDTFGSRLLEWYRRSKRDLPWRRTSDPYCVWISEVMLQQTTVSTVIPYYERWIRRYPTMSALADADEQDVLNAWKGLGYYSRARNIRKAAQIMVRDFGGRVPDDPAVLLKLPGFGAYTVGAVLSIAYGRRSAIIDANIRRIVMRLHAIRGAAEPSQDAVIRPLVEALLPESDMGDFNQAFMELGALICVKQPQCRECPVADFCQARAAGVQEEIPAPRSKSYLDVDAVCAVIRRGDEFYISRRAGGGVLSGLWEFPCREKGAGESGRQTVRRILEESAFHDPVHLRELCVVRHSYTNHRVKLEAYLCDVEGDAPVDENRRWVTAREIPLLPMHSGAVKVARHLLSAVSASPDEGLVAVQSTSVTKNKKSKRTSA